MRISDWSSDVCSSDLSASSFPTGSPPLPIEARSRQCAAHIPATAGTARCIWCSGADGNPNRQAKPNVKACRPIVPRWVRERERSEEHTSELQSLMRISYAVFCLKKKIKNNRQQQRSEHSDTSLQYQGTKYYRRS